MKSLKKQKGVMLVLSSPSGAGKSSICRALLDLDKKPSPQVLYDQRGKK